MYDICVVGCGRVGLPLALYLEVYNFKVCGVDIDKDIICKINSKVMPFKEGPCQDYLDRSNIKIYDILNDAEYPNASTYIITVGTPLKEHIESDISFVKSCITKIIKNIDIKDRTIILRSTVSPGTTSDLVKYIELLTEYKIGKDFYMVMAPERIAEGSAFLELSKLPQIIGCEDDKSFEKAEKIFKVFNKNIFKVSFIEAELIKLFTNIYRYIKCAIPNYFTYISNNFGVDFYKILDKMKYEYPRNSGLMKPGLTAGTCLRKDFGLISENLPFSDILMQSYKTNEYMPKYYVDIIKKYINKKDSIGILGYTMKANCDDTRDSLVPKMIRYLERINYNDIIISDSNLVEYNYEYCDDYNNYRFINVGYYEVISESDIIIIAMNHRKYYDLGIEMFKGKVVIDIWNIFGKGLVIDLRKEK
jgi:UDP-N-acetyl-D-mannosaminuronic acid dehydrogenase